MLRHCAILLFLLTTSGQVMARGPGKARAGGPISVGVLEFTSRGGISQQQMDSLGEMVAAEIMKFDGYRVISKGDIASMLDLEAKKQMLGCSDDKCMAEIGGALGVDQLLTGNVSAFGESFLVNLRLLDVRKVEVIDALSLRLKGDTADLLSEMPNSVRELFGQEVILPERFELQFHFIFGDALLAEPQATEAWWADRGYERYNVWGDGWVDLGGDEDSQGTGTGKGWLLAARFGLRVGKLHTVFAQVAYGQEHWRGKAQVGEDDPIPWRLDMDLHALRLSAGYRFAYPVLDWLWPFAEFNLGVHMLFGSEMETGSGDALGILAPEPRIMFSISPGLRFQFAGNFFASMFWVFDLPLGEMTFSGPALALGSFF